MTAEEFRRLALELPEAVEDSHMGHPDFRLAGKVFASLGAPGPGWAMVKLTPDEQALRVELEPDAFVPAAGAWGRRGYTGVRLAAAGEASVRSALLAAWRNTAPKRLLRTLRVG